MFYEDLLAWLGNFINFLILIYITLVIVNTQCFDIKQLLITTFGLVISIIINIYTTLKKRQ